MLKMTRSSQAFEPDPWSVFFILYMYVPLTKIMGTPPVTFQHCYRTVNASDLWTGGNGLIIPILLLRSVVRMA